MSNKETNIAEAAKKPDTLILLEKMFAEIGAALHHVNNNLYAFTYEQEDVDKCYRLLIEVYEDSPFIEITDFDWHIVCTEDIEEFTRIQSAINEFNRKSRAKVVHNYLDDDSFTLSTTMYCPLFEGLPCIHDYFIMQLDGLIDAREYVLPPEKLKNLPFWILPLSSQPKTNKEVVLEALKELRCVPEIDEDDDSCCSVSFQYQEEDFSILIFHKHLHAKLYGPYSFIFDADIDALSFVKDVVNYLNSAYPVSFFYKIEKIKEDGNMDIAVSSFLWLPCVEGKNFTELLRKLLWDCFHAKNEFLFSRAWYCVK